MNYAEVLHTSPTVHVGRRVMQGVLDQALESASERQGYDLSDLSVMVVAVSPEPIVPRGFEPEPYPEEIIRGSRILFVGEVNPVDVEDQTRFAALAAHRAIRQRSFSRSNDRVPMEELGWIRLRDRRKIALHKAAAASVDDIHVGVFGDAPHHNRLVAIEVGKQLSSVIGRQFRRPELLRLPVKIPVAGNISEIRTNLEWLNSLPRTDGLVQRETNQAENYKEITRLLTVAA